MLHSKLDAAVYEQHIEDAREAGDIACRRLVEGIQRRDEQGAERLVEQSEFHCDGLTAAITVGHRTPFGHAGAIGPGNHRKIRRSAILAGKCDRR
jgi:hypothetical protein